MRARDLLARVVVAALVALVVVAVVAAPPLLSDGGPPSTDVSTPEYDPASIGVEKLPAEGAPEPTAAGGGETVVIDDSHSNRFDRADIEPLVRALTGQGATVEFYGGEDLNETLEDADAFVVIDPAVGFEREEVREVINFTDTGGRLLIAGEPDRITIEGGLFGVSITTLTSDVTSLAGAYGMSFETAYLYNEAENDGNYRNVFVRSGERGPDIERAVFYTATVVHSRTGQPVLRTVPGTRTSSRTTTDQYAVGVVDDNVLAYGDTTFMRADRSTIADNEAVLAYTVDFLLEGERTEPATAGDGAVA